MQKDNFLYKLTVVLLGFSSYACINTVTPVLSEIAAYFPQAKGTTINLIVTIPTIAMLVGLMLSAFLSTKIKSKNIVILGLSIIIFFGIAPHFFRNLTFIIVSRALLGTGIGLLTPIQTRYFADFEATIRTKLFAYNSLLNAALSSLLFMTIGAFSLRWYNVFWLNASMIIILLLVIFILPKESTAKEENVDEEITSNKSTSLLHLDYIFSCVAIALVQAGYLVLPTTLSFYISAHNLGGLQEASNLSAATTIFVALSGLAFPIMRKFLGKHTATVSFLIPILGFVIYAFPVNMFNLWCGFILVPVGATLLYMEFSMQYTESIAPSRIALASAIFTACTFGGQFLSTYYQNIVITLFNATAESAYLFFAVITVILMIFNLLIRIKSK